MNYARQYLKWLQKNPKVRPYVAGHIQQIKRSQMFSLPDGGSFVTDAAVQLLDDVSLIQLPFKDIILEYNARGLDNENDGYAGHEWVHSDKRIIFVRDNENTISIAAAWDYRGRTEWWQTPWFMVNKTEFLDMRVGRRYFMTAYQCPLAKLIQSSDEAKEAAARDIAGEVTILARFIAALACKNVGTERVDGVRDKISKKKSALPYNSYHRLVIKRATNNHCSGAGSDERRGPREHLRRGHIRRLNTGGHIWVNAALVNPGVGGVVHKDYKIA